MLSGTQSNLLLLPGPIPHAKQIVQQETFLVNDVGTYLRFRHTDQ